LEVFFGIEKRIHLRKIKATKHEVKTLASFGRKTLGNVWIEGLGREGGEGSFLIFKLRKI